MTEDRYIIVACFKGKVEVWQGHYGWRTVDLAKPYQIAGAHKYRTKENADTALRGLRKRYSRLGQLARVYVEDIVWLNDHELDLALLREGGPDEVLATADRV